MKTRKEIEQIAKKDTENEDSVWRINAVYSKLSFELLLDIRELLQKRK